jgi:hypothetical protein
MAQPITGRAIGTLGIRRTIFAKNGVIAHNASSPTKPIIRRQRAIDDAPRSRPDPVSPSFRPKPILLLIPAPRNVILSEAKNPESFPHLDPSIQGSWPR